MLGESGRLRRRRLSFFLAGAFLLAGCASNDPPAVSNDPLPGDAPPTPYKYRCADQTEEGPCWTTVVHPTDGYGEPYAAADPSRAGVYAVGVIVGPLEGTRGLTDLQNDLFISTDHGATWTFVETPRPEIPHGPLDLYYGFDPSLAFDSGGTLHQTGIAGWVPADKGYQRGEWEGNRVYYQRSHDLGRTWEKQVIHDDQNVDRNWINIDGQDRIYVTWQFALGDAGSALALSEDGGDSWTTFRPPELQGCYGLAPRIAFVGDHAVLACGALDANGTHYLRVVSFDPATQAFQVLAEHDVEGNWWGAAWPMLVRHGDKLLVFIDIFDMELTEGRSEVSVAESADGGHTWSNFRDTTSMVPPGLPQGRVVLQWAETDPMGRAHLFWRGIDRPMTSDVNEAPYLETKPMHRTAYTILDLHDGAPQFLAVGEGEEEVDVKAQTVGQPVVSDFLGIAFGPDQRALITWSEHYALQTAILEPVLSEVVDV